MKLIELDPKWIHPHLFTFLCPHCKEVRLTCKNVNMKESVQFDLYHAAFGDDWHRLIVPAEPNYSWLIEGTDFSTLTVSPSIDAGRSGHWHGFIRQGQIS